ncbi:hypothetical protein B0O80DRAFT_432624 [Mortierella sp. GBAus27b]|nr:hypothetical protein B0O80DRAFT_432624 [Mortierella sp. GBAus27b]
MHTLTFSFLGFQGNAWSCLSSAAKLMSSQCVHVRIRHKLYAYTAEHGLWRSSNTRVLPAVLASRGLPCRLSPASDGKLDVEANAAMNSCHSQVFPQASSYLFLPSSHTHTLHPFLLSSHTHLPLFLSLSTFKITMADNHTFSRPCSAVRKDTYVMLEDRPCVVINISSSDEGITLSGKDLFGGDMREGTFRSDEKVTVPDITTVNEYSLTGIEDGNMTLLRDNGEVRVVILPEGGLGRKIQAAFDQPYNRVFATTIEYNGELTVVNYEVEKIRD